MKEALTKELVDQLRIFNAVIEPLCAVDPFELVNIRSHLNRLSREINRFTNCLPIYAQRQDLIKTIRSNRVIILKADTGSGKSTQLVQYLSDAEFAAHAVRALAVRVAQEFGYEVGEDVISKVYF
ncbi:unnamed protein product [Rotaria socialis]|uniref:Uncharacterized protein n=1 Tax=Rotaria socialis TaxID=392032 RepID=A0A821EAF1_9BILA|nr:unnamed protein product [Rotaria socialis]